MAIRQPLLCPINAMGNLDINGIFFPESNLPQEEYWGLNILPNGSATLWSEHLHPLGTIVKLRISLSSGSWANIECLVADCCNAYCEKNLKQAYTLMLVLLDSEGLPCCGCQKKRAQTDLQLPS